MRTRFLNTDYFNFNPSTDGTLTFLHLLPPPYSSLPNSSTISSFEHHFHVSLLTHNDDNSSVPSLHIEHFPIDSALSKFLSDVIPHPIIHYPQEDEVLFEHKEEASPKVETEIPKTEDGINVCKKDENEFGPVQFETPLLDPFSVDASFYEKEDIQFHSEITEVENETDMLMPGIQCPFEAEAAVYLVEDIASSFDIDKKFSLLDNDGSVQEQHNFKHSTFPLLEVDEISLGISMNFSIEDDLRVILDNIEPQQQTHMDTADEKELLCAKEIHVIEYYSVNCLEQCHEFESSETVGLNLFLDMDFVTIMGTSHIEGNFAPHQEASDCYSYFSVDPIIFQEFQFLDMDASLFFDAFSDIHKIEEPEVCDHMLKEEMSVRKFDELVVIHELVLVDNAFRSLPVPVFPDHEHKTSMCYVLWNILEEIKPQLLFISDEIYLDWHLLEEDKWNHHTYGAYQKVLEDANNFSSNYVYEAVDDENWVFDTLFAGDGLTESNIGESKESLNLISGSPVHSKKLFDGNPANEELLSASNVDRASLIAKSISQFNDLEFFLNPQKSTAGEKKESAVKPLDANAKFHTVSPEDSIAAYASSGAQFSQWNIKLHQVKLSDNILVLIDNFQKCYLAILENITEVRRKYYSFFEGDKVKLLALSMRELMDSIRTSASQTSAHGDENILAIVTLCAIKQMAWYLCFYGIHVAQLYVDNLCRNLDCLKFRLCFLQSLIVDAHSEADREITRLHPSLSVIQEILWSSMSQSNLKALLVAEKVFWWSLKRLLTSMGISFNELQTPMNRPDACDNNGSLRPAIESLLHSDCLLVSPKDATAAIPFDKFGIVLECGGSYGSSRISTISQTAVGLPCLHFLKVKLEEHNIPKALCEDGDMSQSIGFTMEERSYSTLFRNMNMNVRKLEGLLNSIPSVDDVDMIPSEAVDKVEARNMPLPVSCAPDIMCSEPNQLPVSCNPSQLIIVNTKNIDKEMIVSRRSTYQRILALEKEGAQVVERDSDLPVDVIITASVCLVWYDSRNIKTKAAPTDEASSCLPLWVEHIATNVLTMLSFAFNGCFLVFEGDSSFIVAIMESSDGLNAAAASLGIDIQIFYSHSSELTDELVVNCINSTKLCNGLFPRMPEAETLAESFLTKFPSINPLSAHAMLSFGGILIEFLESSHEDRIHAIRNFSVPEESVAFLSALCKYGEREDSKSGMTDCSSSVSSAPDSDYFHIKTWSERNKRKLGRSPSKFEMPVDDLVQLEPPNPFVGSGHKPYRELKLFNSEILDGPEMLAEIDVPSSTLKDKFLCQNQGSDGATRGNKHRLDVRESEVLHEDFIGEVIDFNNSSLPDKNFFSMANSSIFSPLVQQSEKDPAARNSKIVRRLSFNSCHPKFPSASEIHYDLDIQNPLKNHNYKETEKDPAEKNLKFARRLSFNSNHSKFPSASEINYDLDIQNPIKNKNDSFREGHTVNHHKGLNMDNMPSARRKDLLREGKESVRSSNERAFQEETSHYGGTPFRNAICSSQLQQGSPWTIEFLNRYREKSRLRQKSLSCDTSSPDFGHFSGNAAKNIKRKSPSILDFYKYQGVSGSKKITEPKKHKQVKEPPSSSMREKNQVPFHCSWTPTDKRARRTLSFASNGNGSQSKLVWSEGDVQPLDRRF